MCRRGIAEHSDRQLVRQMIGHLQGVPQENKYRVGNGVESDYAGRDPRHHEEDQQRGAVFCRSHARRVVPSAMRCDLLMVMLVHPRVEPWLMHDPVPQGIQEVEAQKTNRERGDRVPEADVGWMLGNIIRNSERNRM